MSHHTAYIRPVRQLLGLLALTTLVLAACGDDDATTGDTSPQTTDQSTADAAGDLDSVCAAGAEDGSFTYWATFEPENWSRIYDAFAEQYPGIDAELLPLRPQESVQRVLTAASAGQDIEPDLINGNLDALQPLADRELVDTDVDWASLGVPDDLVHPTGLVRIYRVPNGLAYNTETTDPADLPDTWEDLVDPAFAGNVVVDPRGNPFTTLAIEWGLDQTLDYVQSLEDVVQPVVIEGGTAGMVAVVSGEVQISSGGRADSNAEMQADGAPIDVKYLDVVPTQDYHNLVVADSDSRNAALCFAGWLASPEGAAVHEEVEFKSNESVPPSAPEGAVTVSIETEEDAQLGVDVTNEIDQIWGAGQ